MTKYRRILIFCLSCICFFEHVATDELIVKIKNGTLSGLTLKTRKGREIAAFRGIPYALPPLEKLRFEVSL